MRKFVEIIFTSVLLLLVVIFQSGCAAMSRGFNRDSRSVLNSIPPDAAVSVDGKYVGQTPVPVMLSPSPKTIVFEKPGYKLKTYNSVAATDTKGTLGILGDVGSCVFPLFGVPALIWDLAGGYNKSHKPEIPVTLVEVEAKQVVQDKPQVCQPTNAAPPTASASASVSVTVQSVHAQQLVNTQTQALLLQDGGKCPKCGHDFIPNQIPLHCPYCCLSCHKKYFKLDPTTGKEVDCHKGLESDHGNVDDK